MPRGPRLDAPGVLHHVMARGIMRHAIFRDNRDRDDFVRRLGALASFGAFQVYAWALLPNHFYLLVRTAQRPLARSMVVGNLWSRYAAGDRAEGTGVGGGEQREIISKGTNRASVSI